MILSLLPIHPPKVYQFDYKLNEGAIILLIQILIYYSVISNGYCFFKKIIKI